MVELFDGVPIVTLEDGRKAVIDTGASGADIIANVDAAPVRIGSRLIRPIVAPVDLDGLARAVGVPRLDLLIGASALHEGFTVDFRRKTFAFAVTRPDQDEELALALPYIRPASGLVQSPIVNIDIGGQAVRAVFDTAASYTLWQRAPDESPGEAALLAREDLHVGADGQLVEFLVQKRRETVRLGEVSLPLDVAYLPDGWPSFYPDAVLGADVTVALGASRLVLDPTAQQILFFRKP